MKLKIPRTVPTMMEVRWDILPWFEEFGELESEASPMAEFRTSREASWLVGLLDDVLEFVIALYYLRRFIIMPRSGG